MSRWLTRRVPAWWLVGPTLALLVASIGWWKALQPSATEWGTVSSWVATVGGLIALTFAGRQLQLVLLQRRNTMGEAIAAVLERPTSRSRPQLVVKITNTGPYGAYKVQVQAVERAGAEWTTISPVTGPPGGVLPPSGAWIQHFPLDEGAEQLPRNIGVRISFVDVEGRPWHGTHTLSGEKFRFDVAP